MGFVAYGADGLCAIDVKRTRTIEGADLGALRHFREDYPMASCLMLFDGDRRDYGDSIQFLTSL